ncbi:hypothetical protein B0H13DRAFT_2411693 [Mycena leptocephala]|nr:hypothetical protein B0H13DRAFT_2411693 [Mycena leptocephala]
MSRHLRARIAFAAAARQTPTPALPDRVASRASLRGAGAHPLASSALHAVSESPTPTLYGIIALECVYARFIFLDPTSSFPSTSPLYIYQKRRLNAPTFVVTDVQLEFTVLQQAREDAGGARGQASNLLIASIDVNETNSRLFHAVNALKPQAPATDKKTAFWNSYMRLADDYDKEFQQKYSTDLDTALIFSGLFSAVSSAFIIEIEPQLASNHRLIIVVVQSMLYISLFTTLLAALLAVLGKQWIMYYLASGDRGTIEERGLERQRKLDGLVKWKFDAVLQMFPLLLQLSLLLFASSLSVYLWTINHAIAIIVMVLTGFGLGSYLFLLVSAMKFPDCPFQSPLAPFLIQVFSPCWKALYSLQYKLPWKYRRLLSDFKIHRPRFAPHKPVDPYADYFFDPPSPEVPAVLWTLGTTTDPVTIAAAAEIGIDLQWPVQASIETEVDRLSSTLLNARADSYPCTLRNGMTEVAFACGKLFGSLRLVESSSFPLGAFSNPTEADFADSPAELKNILHIVGGDPDLIRMGEMSPSSISWIFHVLPPLREYFGLFGSNSPLAGVKYFLDQFQAETVPSLDLPGFTNYLCCLCSFIGPVDARIMVQIDKRYVQNPKAVALYYS